MTGPGLIYLVGGINDVLLMTRSWTWALERLLPHRIATLRWQQGLWATLTFADLWNTQHHDREAERFAYWLRSAIEERPDEPIHVIAHSAGTALTAYALERLGPTETITSAVFVGSGLSPKYDLSAALQHCRAGILAIDSPLDAFFLGLGTSLLGTVDRRWCPAAGMVGFQTPSDVKLAEKLNRVCWSPWRHVRQGWIGGHLSVASPGFVRGTLVPWIRQAEGSVAVGG